jgi:hypothetical protein
LESFSALNIENRFGDFKKEIKSNSLKREYLEGINLKDSYKEDSV